MNFSSRFGIAFLAAVCGAAGQSHIRGDNAGTNVHTAAPMRAEPKIAWETVPRYRDSGAMVVTGGVLVTGNTTGRGGIYAYDAATGKQLWTLPGQMRGGPAVSGGAAFMVAEQPAGYRFRLMKTDARTGKVLWSVEEEDLGPSFGAPLVESGVVALVNRIKGIAAFDEQTGKELWRHAEAKVCSGILASAGGTLYFAGATQSGMKNLTALDLRTGRELWSVEAKPPYQSRCTGPPTVAQGMVFTRVDSEIFAIDAATGALRWKRLVRESPDDPRSPQAYLSEFSAYEGTIYAATPGGIQGWEAATGRPVFYYPATIRSGDTESRLPVVGGVLYFHGNSEISREEGGGSGWLYAFDLKSKQLLWKHHAARPSQYDKLGRWSTNYFLPTGDGLYYETAQRLVKLVP